MSKIAKLVEDIKGLTLLEAAEVAKTLKEDLNLPDAAPMMMGVAAAAAPVEEQTEFTVVLSEFPADKKISIIKVVREITGLGLGEAKAFVESPLPKEVKEGLSKKDAEDMKKKFEDAGAKVVLK